MVRIMELKDFISETLSQLVDGILDAQKKVQPSGARIAPSTRNNLDHKSIIGRTNDKLPVTAVDFEVLLDIQKGTGTKGRVGVVAGIFNLGSQGESSKNSTTTNKIKFTVPVALPLQPYKQE